jgi:hypothetical protein
VTGPGPFGPEGRRAFGRDGFLVARGLLGPEVAGRLRVWTDELMGWPEVAGRWMVYGEQSLTGTGRLWSRIENFAPYHQGFRDLFDGPALLGGASALLGQPAVLFKDKINFKLPGGDGFRPHQDQQAGWSAYAPLFLTALVAVDEATAANGCLELAPGHHTRGLLGREWEPLADADLAGVEFVPCPARPGDVVFFDSYVPHRSGPNLSGEARRVLYVTYNRRADGDHRARYFADKRRSYPPDVEREAGRTYTYRV